MDINQIVELVVAALPSVIAVLTTVACILKTLKEFKTLKNQVADMKAIEDLRDELKQVIQENYTLKKQINQTIAKIDRIHRSDKE